MKILLLQPKLRKYIQPKLPPLGLLSIAACLEQAGHQVRIIDLNVSAREFNENLLKDEEIVGVTATTPLIKEAWRLLKVIKNNNLPVIFGGPHPSALPEESLRQGVDIVVRGEGEHTIVELLNQWPNIEEISGISYLKNDKIVNSSPRTLIQNLDQLPFPAYHLLEDINKYTAPQPVITKPVRTLTMVTSRGCPFGCTYCFKGIFGRSWRAHSPEYVVNLWQHLYEKYQVEMIGIEDDSFNINYQRVEEICRLLKERKIKTIWTTAQGLRADNVDINLLRKMKEVGFNRTGFGIEAGSQEIIDKINKNLILDKVKEAIKACKELKIEAIGYFMVGNYGENEKTMRETIKLACTLDLEMAHFTTAVPLPGSPLFEIVKREGKFLIDDWDLYGYTKGLCFFEVGEVKKELVEKMWKKAYRCFYLRPKVFFRFMLKKSSWQVLPSFIRAGLAYLGIIKN